MLHRYAYRGLTVASDNLVAVSAIASLFHARLRADYFAGIWQGDLIHGLLWNSGGYDINFAVDFSAPSRNWASLSDLEFAFLPQDRPLPHHEDLVEVLDINTIPSTMNPFGLVHSGLLTLRGRVWRAEAETSRLILGRLAARDHWLKVKSYFKNIFMLFIDTSLIVMEISLSDGVTETSLRRVRRDEAGDDFYIGNLKGREKINLFMLPLLKECYGSRRNIFYGLILGRSPKDLTKFERVGAFCTRNLTADRHDSSLDDCDEQEIVII